MKPRSDSKLKLLPEERQDQIIGWINTPKSEKCPGGLLHAQEQLALDGIKVSLRALSEFSAWWRLRERYARAESRTEQVMELLKSKDPNMAPERIRELGQALFTMEALQSPNSEEYVNLEYLKLAQDSARDKGEIEREKLQLSKQKYRRQTCKDFLDWYQNEQARKIADGAGTNAEKIEQLGRAMFDDWDEE